MDSQRRKSINGTTGLKLKSASNYTHTSNCFLLSIFLLAFILNQEVQSAAVIEKRSIDLRETEENTIEQCRTNGICGWEVYDSDTRDLKYYVAHTCKCPPAETCIRTEDNLTISAYIYQCRVIPTRKNKNKSSRPNVS